MKRGEKKTELTGNQVDRQQEGIAADKRYEENEGGENDK